MCDFTSDLDLLQLQNQNHADPCLMERETSLVLRHIGPKRQGLVSRRWTPLCKIDGYAQSVRSVVRTVGYVARAVVFILQNESARNNMRQIVRAPVVSKRRE